MKKIRNIFIVSILLIIYIYVYNIDTIPNSIVLFEGDNLNLKLIKGLSLNTSTQDYESEQTSINLNKQQINKPGTKIAKLNLFGRLKLKDVNLNVIPETEVIPIGKAIGMKLYTKGVLVVGMTEVESDQNAKIKPFENSGISEGDSIIEVNNKNISNTNDLIEEVNKCKGKALKIKYLKNNQTLETNITPIKTKQDYKIGLWVRDAAAGIGTLTFYEPSTDMFISLGHGIIDIDTGEIVDISSGELITANIISIVKGEKDLPGEIKGTVTNGNIIGTIYKNTNLGVYGKTTNKQYLGLENKEKMKVAPRKQIKLGKAKVRCQLDNDNTKDYEIEIEKLYIDNNNDNKSMLIKITDKELLEKTGGIIQGMSGAPIIQDGQFIGAITNVLVKDPTQGYAIFGDLLIKQMRETK